jgi:hypothetical protein
VTSYHDDTKVVARLALENSYFFAITKATSSITALQNNGARGWRRQQRRVLCGCSTSFTHAAGWCVPSLLSHHSPVDVEALQQSLRTVTMTRTARQRM